MARRGSVGLPCARRATHPHSKWEALCDGLSGPQKTLVAILFQNQYKHFRESGKDPDSLLETTKVLNIGNFDKYAFPMIRAIYPNLISSEIVSVQPMAGPVSLVFYMDFLAGTTKGDVTSGDALFDARTGPKNVENFSSNTIPNEVMTISSNNAVGASTGKLAYSPVKPGTFRATVTYATGVGIFGDDGAGGIILLSQTSGAAPTIGGGSAITYSDGTVTLDFTENISAATATYAYDWEASDVIPQVDLNITSAALQAKERKIRGRHSLKAAQDLQALHGLDAQAEIGAALAQIIRFEIDREVINDLYNFASAGNVTFDKTVPFGVSWEEHKKTFVDTLILNSSQVFRATRRCMTNWVVAGLQVCNIIESLAESIRIGSGTGISAEKSMHRTESPESIPSRVLPRESSRRASRHCEPSERNERSKRRKTLSLNHPMRDIDAHCIPASPASFTSTHSVTRSRGTC